MRGTMAHVFTRPFRVRGYECDMLGHLNNAVYQHYCEQISIEASEDAGYDMDWYAARGTGWVVRQISVEYLHPVTAGDVLDVTTWVSGWRGVRAQREYLMRRPARACLCVSARRQARAAAPFPSARPCTIYSRRQRRAQSQSHSACSVEESPSAQDRSGAGEPSPAGASLRPCTRDTAARRPHARRLLAVRRSHTHS